MWIVCMVCLLPVLSLQLHRYPKCIAKGRTPGGGINATDRLSCSTVVFLLNCLLPLMSTIFLILTAINNYSVTVIYNIHKYIFYKVRMFKPRFHVAYRLPWLLYAWKVLGTLPIVYIFLFFIFYIFILLFYFLLFFIILLRTQNDWAVVQVCQR